VSLNNMPGCLRHASLNRLPVAGDTAKALMQLTEAQARLENENPAAVCTGRVPERDGAAYNPASHRTFKLSSGKKLCARHHSNYCATRS
jgi:hypothetical protein